MLDTIKSVAAQTALLSDHLIHYKICCADPNATDQLQGYLQSLTIPDNLYITYICEPDKGLYDAVGQSFANAPQVDMYSYLGSGDMYAPSAFEIVAQVVEAFEIDWITGLIATMNDQHHLIRTQVPFTYNNGLIRQGVYGSALPHIQQESTFWSQRLHNKVDTQRFRRLRYAGDFYLWYAFSDYAELHFVNAWLGTFEVRPGQLSEKNRCEYADEMGRIADPIDLVGRVLACVHRLIWSSPDWLLRTVPKGYAKQYCIPVARDQVIGWV